MGGFAESKPCSKKKDQISTLLEGKGSLKGQSTSTEKIVKVFKNCTMKNKNEIDI